MGKEREQQHLRPIINISQIFFKKEKKEKEMIKLKN